MFHTWPVKMLRIGGQFQAEVASGKEGHHGDKRIGHEAEDGNALEHVEQREQTRPATWSLASQ